MSAWRQGVGVHARKGWIYPIAAVCGVLAGVAWLPAPTPAAHELSAYQKLPVMEFRLLQGLALGYATAEAHQGLAFHLHHRGTGSFEIRCKGVRVLEVENTPARVLVRMPPDALTRAPDIARLLDRFQRRLVHDPSHARLLAEREPPSWSAARLRGVLGWVPRRQRCMWQ